MQNTEPNVIPGPAAEFVRNLVFEQRATDWIAPLDVVGKLLEAGFGGQFPAGVRAKRLRTWVKQALGRLQKHGWLTGAKNGVLAPTGALRACTAPKALSKRTPRPSFHSRSRPPYARESGPAAPPSHRSAPSHRSPPEPVPARESVPPPAPLPAPPSRPPPESWEGYVDDWVFRHRERTFGEMEIAAALVQRGFGSGDIESRLAGARELAKGELRELVGDGLLVHDAARDAWQPTEVLRTWPLGDGHP